MVKIFLKGGAEMSKDNVKKFFEELEKNPVLKEKFLEALNDSGSAESVISFGHVSGFKFTEKDLNDFGDELFANAELKDEELSQASGGMSKINGILSSILVLGVGCAVISVIEHVKGRSCGTAFSVGGRSDCHD